MADPNGFLKYQKESNPAEEPLKRVSNFNEFHTPLEFDERRKQAARCMNCGVPFCQSGMMINNINKR
jgi:glutamate synthase (NADPH/NADH) small chain